MRVISLEWPDAHAVDGVLGGGGRAAGVEPEVVLVNSSNY